MYTVFQTIKNRIVLYIKINMCNLVIGSLCVAIALWLFFSSYSLQSYYVNLLLQFFIPVFLVVPIVEKAKPFFSREIGEIIGGTGQTLFYSLLFAEIPCMLYIGFLAMSTKYLIDNTGGILSILIFQTFIFQGIALIAFILSGTIYTGCTVPFLLQMISVFMLVEIPEFSDFTLISEVNYNIKEYFVQRWYGVIILIFEWWGVYMLYRNRFRFCKLL